MKDKILEQFDKEFPEFNGSGAQFPIFKNNPNREHIKQFLSQALDEYADWKIGECLPEKAKNLYFNALQYPNEAIGKNQAFGWNACIDQILINKDKIK